MASESGEKHLDHLAVNYPTSQVTFGRMRQLEPGKFTTVLPSDMNLDIFPTHSLEQRVAEKAFAKAQGAPDPHPRWERRDLVSELNRAYKEYGLSAGIEQSKQMVRRFEAEAARQAARVGR